MTNTKTNIQSKSILARLLANEDISVIHSPEAETASFDTRDRVLTLPCWKDMGNSLYDMLVGHEVAHALYTPTGDGWVDSIDEIAKDLGIDSRLVKMYVNVVEDARIERKIKTAFPGLRRDFFDAYVDLLNRDLFGIDGQDPKDLTLIDRVNLHYKLGLHAGISIPFHPTEQVWIDRIDTLQTWDDVLEVVRDMMESLADENEDTDEPDSPETGEGGTGEGETGNEGTPENGTPEDGDTGSGDSEDGDTGSGEGNEDTDAPEGDSGSGGGGDDQEGDSQESPTINGGKTRGIDAPITEDAISNASNDARDDSANGYCKPNDQELPTVDLDKCIVGYRKIYRELFAHSASSEYWSRGVISTNEFVAKSRKVVNVLAKQFEMKKQADAHKRVQISKTGTLDTVKMMNYKWSEDVFRKAATVREGKNHGLVMFLDWSGSMCDNIEQTMDQMIQLVLFCKKVNIPFEVYAFSTEAQKTEMWSDMAVDPNGYYDYPVSKTGMSDFALLNLFSSKMTKAEFDASIVGARYLAEAQNTHAPAPREYRLGGTPLDEAIVAAFTLIPRFREENRVQIVNTVFMTDGCSNGNQIGANDYLRIKGKRMGVQGTTGCATGNLMELLQKTTGTNAIGMYLSNLSMNRFVNSWETSTYFNTPEERDAAGETWKDDNYAISTNSKGYAEHFIIKGNKKVENSGLEDLPANASNTRIKNAFLKSAGAKMTSRVVLNRFIDIIA